MSKKRLNRMVRGFVWSLLAVFISCSEEKEWTVTDGEEITTSVTVEVPEVFRTRAVPAGYPTDAKSYLGESGYPSIGNVDLNKHPLAFTVAVYVEKTVNGNKDYTFVDQQSRLDVNDDKADFNFRLMKGQTYRIVAYADFSKKEQANLDNISIAPGLNDELKDAFFVTQDFIADDNLTVVLKRPFGKLRLIARDFSTFAKGGVLKIEEIKVTYKETVTALATNSFNAITGQFNEIEEGISREFTADPVIYPKEHEGETTPYAAVFTMYLPVNFGTEDTSGKYTPVESGNPVPQSWMHPFDIEVTYKNESGTTTTIKRSFEIDIPIKRNWLTTIDAADFWTDNSRITVSIDHRFEGFIYKEPETYYVYTGKELRDAITAIEKTSERTGRIVLGANITQIGGYGGVEIGYYYNKTSHPTAAPFESEDITLDLNGHKLTTDVIPQYGLGLINVYGPVTLRIVDTSPDANGVIESPWVPDENGNNKSVQTIIAWRYGSHIIVDGGKIKARPYWWYDDDPNKPPTSGYYETEAIYLGGPIRYVGSKTEGHLGLEPNSLTINSGWFECVGIANPECLINLENSGPVVDIDGKDQPGHIGYGKVYVNGGSFVEFNPSNGDNKSGNYTNQWVDDDHTVLTETVEGKTVYTVIPKNSPEYHH
ncbi:DUF6562 domain-containing protein [Bacteroides sp. AN502(2024)]|uniref:DUF6562 domain-containing protein n=1 Tax=Bacteroides sp. AN502(2024) TaxID=3160599 RepID=UPI003516AD41